MKMLSALVLIISSVVISFGQFELCNSNTDEVLNDVYFVDQNIGIAVGDSGIIIRSVDGGLNWSTVKEVGDFSFTKIKFWDQYNGIVIGDAVYTTNDSGENWNILELENAYFLDIELIENDAAIISGYPSILYRIDQFGKSTELLSDTSFTFEISHLSFVNDSVGFGHSSLFPGGVENILITNDGGRTWQSIESPYEISIIEDISFISEEIGYRGGWYNSHLMKTIDAGLHWQQVDNCDASDQNPYWSAIIDFHIIQAQSDVYYACGWYGNIFKSVNNGDCWTALETPTDEVLNAIYFIDDTHGWAVGQHGVILKTNNGGISNRVEIAHPQIYIYPNPVTDQFQISGISEELIERINIIAIDGREIDAEHEGLIINMEKFSHGMYFIFIQTKTGIFMKQVMKS